MRNERQGLFAPKEGPRFPKSVLVPLKPGKSVKIGNQDSEEYLKMVFLEHSETNARFVVFERKYQDEAFYETTSLKLNTLYELQGSSVRVFISIFEDRPYDIDFRIKAPKNVDIWH